MKKNITFLKDVFITSLGAYGGPSAHYSIFLDHLVIKKKYLSEEELTELIALCTILPGPSSTQTIVAIGYKIGGAWLAFLTMLVWAIPVIILMTALSFVSYNFSIGEKNIFRFVSPMAVAFIIVAAFRIGRKVLKEKLNYILFIISCIASYFFRTPIVFPLLILFAFIITIISSKEKQLFNKVEVNPNWNILITFTVFALLSTFLSFYCKNMFIDIFESFYRYGYLVFGGGQVVIPVMYTEVVEVKNLMTNTEFLLGYGLVQGLPGPMFSFSAYIGGLAARNLGAFRQIISAILSSVSIFLPGLLLIYFVYPIWERIKLIKAVKISLKGINSVAAGMIFTSAIILFQKVGLNITNIVVILLVIIAVAFRKIPVTIIVLITLILGILI